MPQPYDYSLGNVPDPSQAFTGGLQQGMGIQNMMLQRQQQQQALAIQQQQQQALQSLVTNPNASGDDYSRVMAMIPSIAEPLQKAWAVKNTEQQQSALSDLAQWSAAIQQGQPQVASDLMRQRADAIEATAGGKPTRESQLLRAKAGIVDQHPEMANSIFLKPLLMAHPDGKKYVDNIVAMGKEGRDQELQHPTLAKAKADAGTADATQALKWGEVDNQPTATVLGNQKTAQEIKASQLSGDISKLNAQIAGANSETERGRLTLERDKLVLEQQKMGQAQGQAAQDAQNQSTSALQTVQDIKTHRGMDAFWTAPGTKWGAIWRVVPGSDRQALETNIDALKGQLGYSNLMAAKASSPTGASGFGALSDSELKLLSSLAGNLDPNSADFPTQLVKVERYLQKAQSTAVARPGLPNKGEAFVAKVPGIGNVDEGHINALMRQYPGSTRDQVLMFLKSQSGDK